MHKSKTSYERLRALCKDESKRFYVFSNENHAETYAEDVVGESANDRNDRAIRVAAGALSPRDSSFPEAARRFRTNALQANQGRSVVDGQRCVH